jgi:chromate reductase, NAD(P)H dehydrogenase (quinone)
VLVPTITSARVARLWMGRQGGVATRSPKAETMAAERLPRVGGPNGLELRIVALAGSLRRDSFNRALLRAARQLASESMTIELIEIGDLPFYNADVEAEGDPPTVVTFKASLRDADGVLIATPEYNDGIPGVLTNAIDWGSRLPGRAPLAGKPVALVGASPSQVGTARAQSHLRQLLGHVHARTLPPPELLVARAHEKFDAELRLADEGTRRVLAALLERFASWIAREQAAREADRALATAVAAQR